MKIILKLFLIVLFEVTALCYSIAQNSFEIHIGIAHPLSDFESVNVDTEKAGGAQTGIDFGFQYAYHFRKAGFGLYASVDANYNGIKDDIKDHILENYFSLGILYHNYVLIYPDYYNIPVSVGLLFPVDFGKKVTVHGQAGVTYNFLKVSELSLETGTKFLTEKFSLSRSVGFKAGIGILIKRKVTFGVNYFWLSEQKVDGELNIAGFPSEEITGDLKVDIITFTFGYMIFSKGKDKK